MNWILTEDKKPEGEGPFVAYDANTSHYAIGTINMLHGRAGKQGIFMPARYGEGMQVTHWLPLPQLSDEDKCAEALDTTRQQARGGG